MPWTLLLPLGLGAALPALPSQARPWPELQPAPRRQLATRSQPTATSSNTDRLPLPAPPSDPLEPMDRPTAAASAFGRPEATAEPGPWALRQLRLAPPAAVAPGGWDPLLGRRSHLAKDWLGLRPVAAGTAILILAGHADAQGGISPGTSGEAVDRYGARPMTPGISDELHWNLVIAQAVTQLGQQRGLPISLYLPPERSIRNGDHPATNWSVGRRHVAAGGYALELHLDAYGRAGVGSGLIPPLDRAPSQLDEALARSFGAFPLRFRDGLGGPKRGLALLEVGQLEGSLEASLRDPQRRDATVAAISARIVEALEAGLQATPSARDSLASGQASQEANTTFSGNRLALEANPSSPGRLPTNSP